MGQAPMTNIADGNRAGHEVDDFLDTLFYRSFTAKNLRKTSTAGFGECRWQNISAQDEQFTTVLTARNAHPTLVLEH